WIPWRRRLRRRRAHPRGGSVQSWQRSVPSSSRDRRHAMREDVFTFPALERLVYGKTAAHAPAAEVERIGAERVFLVVSGTMNRTTDEVDKVRAALGRRHAATYDGIPPFN